jgi:DNA-binding NarL/FixJ family response regulator
MRDSYVKKPAKHESKYEKKSERRGSILNIDDKTFQLECINVKDYLTYSPLSQCLVTFQEGQENLVTEVMIKGALGYVYNRPNHIAKAKQMIREHGMFVEESAQICLLKGYRAAATKKVNNSLLSAKEVELLQLIADGYVSYSAIAMKLKLSHSTIQNHHYNILMKLNAKSRTEALVLAYKHGLVQIS